VPFHGFFILKNGQTMNEDRLKKQIGLKIRLLRMEKGWSRQQAAEKLELSTTAYGNMERGETDICVTRLAKVAEVFEVGLAELLGAEKTVYHLTGTNNLAENMWHSLQIASHPSELQGIILKNELEKSQLIQQAQEKEIYYLKEENARLKEMLAWFKNKDNAKL
jgi:XRE family transcriptional regulator, regulator of sulfur utilization